LSYGPKPKDQPGRGARRPCRLSLSGRYHIGPPPY